MRSTTYLTTFISLATTAYAQTYTSCNPLDIVCAPDPALGTTFNQTYTSSSSLSDSYWTIPGYPAPSFPSNNTGAAFTITSAGDAPTIQTEFYIFWGSLSVIMKAAPGIGIISSIVLLSDDLDEIDWEIMGGNTTHVETNYYGKGNRTQENAIYYPCDNPEANFHNYTVNWSSEQIQWILDGQVVRTLTPDQAIDPQNKTMYPQTPMRFRIGNWAGGAPGQPEGTVQWAGGATNFADGPFTMTVQELKITDGTTNATKYVYGDMSGDWQSIQIQQGISKANAVFHAPPPLTLTQRWNNLSLGARIAILAVIASVLAISALVFAVFCIKQRKAGRVARAKADAIWEKDQADQLEIRRIMSQKHFALKNGVRGSYMQLN